MPENIYDTAYDLEKVIRQSSEYTQLKEAYDEVTKDSNAESLFKSFRDIQMTLQQKQMQGQEITQEEVEQAQKAAALAQQNEKIGKLLEVEQRMSMMVSELNKIIMKPLEDLYGELDS